MKKICALTLAIIMLACCLTGCGSSKDTVMTVGGTEVSWDEYLYWLESSASDLTSIYYYYVGTSEIDWNGTYSFDTSITNAQWCVNQVLSNIKQLRAIELKAKELGIALDEEDEASMAESIDSYAKNYCGEDATEEDYDAFLKENYNTSLDYQKYIMKISIFYSKLFESMYGENAVDFDDTDAINTYADENGYISANHILLLTTDTETGEALSEEEIAEKQAKAQEIAAELQAITDQDELLARFAELKAEYDEDSGGSSHPNGYCFTNGTMVDEFDSAARTLDMYAVSDPVESTYGYHVIIRLPNDPDTTITTSSTTTTLRVMAAQEQFNSQFSEWTSALEVKFVNGFDTYDFTKLFVDDGFAYVSFDERP